MAQARAERLVIAERKRETRRFFGWSVPAYVSLSLIVALICAPLLWMLVRRSYGFSALASRGARPRPAAQSTPESH